LTIDQQNSNFKLDYDTNNSTNSKSKFIIEEWRRLVGRLWAQSKTETEIARELHCNVSTIYRDIKFLKLSQQFVFDLAQDLGLYYKSCIDTTETFFLIYKQLYQKNFLLLLKQLSSIIKNENNKENQNIARATHTTPLP
jgi:hypothetical protein